MKIFILDDEPGARSTIKTYMLRSELPDLQFKEAGDIQEGLDVLSRFRPDLAFLDIDLGNGTSFDLLSQLSTIDFNIVFVSAHNQFAVQAFKFQALDYILKPINPYEFNTALQKAIHSARKPSILQFEELDKSFRLKRIDKIVVRDQSAIHFLTLADIVYCESESNYTIFHFRNEADLVISRTLAEYEDLLIESNFFRTHRSYLINLIHIKKFDKREGGKIQMKDKSIIPLSRTRRPLFLSLINKMSQ